ncbi:hypothetical protein JT306_08750 [Salmonella enterica subsp. enterica serovar Kentucky]|nr:hypothetical protein [Salmonella enterica subsp. enterica serovar Kentucky]
MLFTGRLVSTHNEANLSRSLNRIIGKSGEPLIRKGVDMAMRLMGEQFVTGETIAQALANARKLEERVPLFLRYAGRSRVNRRRCAGLYGFLPASDSCHRQSV